jgi:hypothetical protein
MKNIMIQVLVLLSLFVSVSFASGVKSQDAEERIEYPNGIELYLRSIDRQWEIGYIKDNKRISLVTSERILTVSQFAQSDIRNQKVWRSLPITKNAQIENASTWFFAMTEQGLHFFRYLPGSKDAPWVNFHLPQIKSVSLNRFSTSQTIFDGETLLLVSFSGEKNEKGTYIIRVVSNGEEKYTKYQVISLNKEFHEFEMGGAKKFKISGSDFNLDGTAYNLKTLFKNPNQVVNKGQFIEDLTPTPKSSILKAGLTSALSTVRDASSSVLDRINNDSNSAPAPTLNKTVPGFQPVNPPPVAPVHIQNESTQEVAVVNNNSGKSGERIELKYKGDKYVVYNLETKGQDGNLVQGVYVERESDKSKVQIATRMVNLSKEGDIEGFSIDEGILKHPDLVRKIDLEKNETHDFFKMEATYTPRKNSSEVAWLDGAFENFRSMMESRVSVIDGRKSIVHEIVEQLNKPNRASSILVGD